MSSAAGGGRGVVAGRGAHVGGLRWLARVAARAVRTAVFRLGGLFVRPHRGPLPAAPARILVLQLQQLGDSVIFTPTLRALRERFPSATIDLLATPAAAQVYRKSPYLDEIHVTHGWQGAFRGAGLRKLLPLLRELRGRAYDCTITDLAQQSFRFALIAWLVRAPWRIGFDIAGRGLLHNVRIPYRADASWVDANLDIARALGATPASLREEVAFDRSDEERVRAALADAGHAPERKLVVMHTGANWQSRTWYPERWSALADAVADRHEATIVFVGGGGERAYVDAVRAGMTRPSVSLAGVTDIPQLAALCRMSDLFVGTDSGPRHIARASGCAHVVVMSAQDDTDQWAGWGRGEVILRSFPSCSGCYFPRCAHKICMDAIETQRVLGWCERALADARAREAEPRQDRIEMPPRLQGMAARGKAVLRALAQAPVEAEMPMPVARSLLLNQSPTGPGSGSDQVGGR
ncbi:MAG: glycosyltransferase family 9 protein [Gemmatimonadaceae bacterium]|nr:glycosyltransferase family 9 protein [Gemmatimonadaceae bacterium]NUQ93644.1 glycosyltransferase family 9 protein [Gemmatimonadaceae bacterium]NUR18756.1 glycosyltransferase family 9 protein [Gemmatimonadaceae bacterium]